MAAASSHHHRRGKFVPEEHLDRLGVTAYLKDAITLLLENRPHKPIEFLADYFKNVVQGSSSLQRSYRYIRLTRRNCAAFMDNVVAAFRTLETRSTSRAEGAAASSSSSTPSKSSKQAPPPPPPPPVVVGLRPLDMLRLLRALCADFPEAVVRRIMTCFSASESTLIPFPQFTAAIHACLVYEEFLDEVEGLFLTLAPPEEEEECCDILSNSESVAAGASSPAVVTVATSLLQEALQAWETPWRSPDPSTLHSCLHHASDPTTGRISFPAFAAALFVEEGFLPLHLHSSSSSGSNSNSIHSRNSNSSSNVSSNNNSKGRGPTSSSLPPRAMPLLEPAPASNRP